MSLGSLCLCSFMHLTWKQRKTAGGFSLMLKNPVGRIFLNSLSSLNLFSCTAYVLSATTKQLQANIGVHNECVTCTETSNF